jgi:hypothetical protein
MKRIATTTALILCLALAGTALAQQTAPQLDKEEPKTFEEIQLIMQRLQQGERELEEARQLGDEEQIRMREREVEENRFQLEDSRVQTLSQESGVPPQQISQMRESGMGWGEIAKELGVHPGVLGYGHHGDFGDEEHFGGEYGEDYGEEHGGPFDDDDHPGRGKGLDKDKGGRGNSGGKGGGHGKGR